MLAIFNFCFSQRSFAMRAPIHGLFALVDISLIGHSTKYANLLRFKAVMQSNVRIFPIAQHTQAFKILTLNIHPFQSEIVAFSAQSQHVQLVAVQAQLLDAGVLDRHTVSIPARNIRSIEAAGIFIFYNDVLQNFIQRRAHVNLAVGIRRAVVQHKFRLAGMQRLLFIINVVFLPEFQKVRFTLRQACAHRELGFRQIQCFAIIHCP